MTHASVFSGIGGPEIAAAMLGWENLFHCEINPFGRAVLNYWFPNSVSYEDITKTDFGEWGGQVDVLTGGFPCQPFSYAGRRGGAQDDRYLWPYMFRCIDQVKPRWVVCENVAGILTMVEQGEVFKMADQGTLFDEGDGVRRYRLRETFTLERICNDLESHGYTVQPVLIPALAVGAPHRRDRVFIVGHRNTSDADRSTNGRDAGENEGEGREERLQERDEVRQSHLTSEIRPESPHVVKNTVRGRRVHGQDEKQGNKRHVGDAGPGNRQRLRGETSRSIFNAFGFGRVERELDNGLAKATQQGKSGKEQPCGANGAFDRWRDFPTVSPIHRGNDGLPFNVDYLTLSLNKWRTESLKAYGNAIVPQVMYEIFKAIEAVDSNY